MMKVVDVSKSSYAQSNVDQGIFLTMISQLVGYSFDTWSITNLLPSSPFLVLHELFYVVAFPWVSLKGVKRGSPQGKNTLINITRTRRGHVVI